MSAKGRVKWPNIQLPSSLEQMYVWTFDERSDRESKAFEALPVTSPNLPILKGGCNSMKDPNCGYCMRGEILNAFGMYICDLSVSTLILFREQSHPGRCIVAYKDHVSELVDISEEERNLFLADVVQAAKAIHAAFHPDKLNYGAYGDTGCHLHMHLVPKYKDGDEWGGTFQMNPGRTFLTDEEYQEMIDKIKAAL